MSPGAMIVIGVVYAGIGVFAVRRWESLFRLNLSFGFAKDTPFQRNWHRFFSYFGGTVFVLFGGFSLVQGVTELFN